MCMLKRPSGTILIMPEGVYGLRPSGTILIAPEGVYGFGMHSKNVYFADCQGNQHLRTQGGGCRH